MITKSINSVTLLIGKICASLNTISNLQRAQVFAWLVPIYKLSYHYFFEPTSFKNVIKEHVAFEALHGNINTELIHKPGFLDFNYLGDNVFTWLQYIFFSLLIINIIHIVRYSKANTKCFNTLIGTTTFSYRVFLGDINLLSGTLLIPLIITIKFIANKHNYASRSYWLQLLCLSLMNSALLLTNVTINTFKLNFIKKLSIWSLLSVGLISLVQCYTDESLMLTTSIYLIINQLILYSTIICFERNFSLSEASILSQLISGLGFDFFMNYFNESNYKPELSEIYILIRAGLVFASIGVYSTVIIRKLLNSSYSGIIGIIVGVALPWQYLIYPSMINQLRQNPFEWLIEYITYSKITQYTIVFWAISITLSIIFISIQTNFKSLNSKRKFFHYLSCLMFIPIYTYNIDFLNIALMVGLGFLLITELYRLSYLPGYKTLDSFINSFRDSKDIGEFVWAHIYLLLGCSITVWIGGLGGLSGVISLGLCDSTASIVGKSIGRTKWFGSKKSVEGSLVFMICCTIGMVYTCKTEFNNLGSLVAKASFYTALLEAVTIENDNLVIPLYLWVLLNLPN